jgi:WD40 repeat protein
LVSRDTALPPNGAAAYAVDATVEVNGFDPKTGAKRFHRVLERGQEVLGLLLARDGALALVIRPDKSATAWEVTTGSRLATIDHFASGHLGGSGLVAVRPPGRPFEQLDLATGQRRDLKGTEYYGELAAALEAQILALQTADELAIWDLATNQLRRTRRGVRTGPRGATFSPDATVLATGSTEPRGVIQLWDVNTLELLDSLPGHSALIEELDFSPDGRVLASLDRDGIVKLWDVVARAELLTLRPFHALSSIRFTPDGRTLAFRAAADGKGWIYLLGTALPEDLASEEGR